MRQFPTTSAVFLCQIKYACHHISCFMIIKIPVNCFLSRKCYDYSQYLHILYNNIYIIISFTWKVGTLITMLALDPRSQIIHLYFMHNHHTLSIKSTETEHFPVSIADSNQMASNRLRNDASFSGCESQIYDPDSFGSSWPQQSRHDSSGHHDFEYCH